MTWLGLVALPHHDAVVHARVGSAKTNTDKKEKKISKALGFIKCEKHTF